jgi:hypothetical protein
MYRELKESYAFPMIVPGTNKAGVQSGRTQNSIVPKVISKLVLAGTVTYANWSKDNALFLFGLERARETVAPLTPAPRGVFTDPETSPLNCSLPGDTAVSERIFFVVLTAVTPYV